MVYCLVPADDPPPPEAAGDDVQADTIATTASMASDRARVDGLIIPCPPCSDASSSRAEDLAFPELRPVESRRCVTPPGLMSRPSRVCDGQSTARACFGRRRQTRPASVRRLPTMLRT